jgi:hypothetical protein
MRWVAYFLRIRAPDASRENLYRASTDLAMELTRTLAINFGQKNPPSDMVGRGIFVA